MGGSQAISPPLATQSTGRSVRSHNCIEAQACLGRLLPGSGCLVERAVDTLGAEWIFHLVKVRFYDGF